MEIDMLTDFQIKQWDHYYSTGKIDIYFEVYGKQYIPCFGHNCNFCEVRDASRTPNQCKLTKEELEEYYELRPEYKIIK